MSEHEVNTREKDVAMSEADDKLDALVEAASVPNLASLFRQAKDRGVITSITMYGEGFVKST